MANSANTATSRIICFNYDFDGDQPKTLIYQGHAHFPLNSTYLRLTKTDDSENPQPLTYSAGRVVHDTPIPVWGAEALADFETTITFIIGTVDNDPADGLVFFIAPVGTTIPSGSSGETFGVFDSATRKKSSVFAVEFDTFVNPDVDPNHRHIGINYESLKSSKTTEVDDAIFGQQVTAQIKYVEATKEINVKVTAGPAGSKTYEVSNVHGLRNVLHHQHVQVGLAASTGANVAIHDVVSWNFTATVASTTAN